MNTATTPYCHVVVERHSNSLFEESWWLDAVCPGRWLRISVQHGNRTVATWPFLVRRRFGLTVLTNPVLTPYLGPWLEPSNGKPTTRIGRSQELLANLLDRLPPHDVLRTSLSPALDFVYPLVWARIHAEPRLTYLLSDITNPDLIWLGMDERRRRAIRRAQERLTIRSDLDAATLWRLSRDRLYEKGVGPGIDLVTFERVVAAARQQDAALILSAHDRSGTAVAGIFVVHDERCAHYLLGGFSGADASGAPALLLWDAIRRLSGRSATFDFEGSMVPNVERFFRGFGGRPTTYYRLSREPSVVRLARAIRACWR